jgi:hypothetical protein
MGGFSELNRRSAELRTHLKTVPPSEWNARPLTQSINVRGHLWPQELGAQSVSVCAYVTLLSTDAYLEGRQKTYWRFESTAPEAYEDGRCASCPRLNLSVQLTLSMSQTRLLIQPFKCHWPLCHFQFLCTGMHNATVTVVLRMLLYYYTLNIEINLFLGLMPSRGCGLSAQCSMELPWMPISLRPAELPIATARSCKSPILQESLPSLTV